MAAGPLPGESPQPAPAPRLLVELPSWPRVFFHNLRDLVAPPALPRLELQSAPAPFWPDVFVKRGLPWRRFFDSGVCHLVACGLLLGVSRLIALQPQAVVRPGFDHEQLVYYRASEFLPPLDTRQAQAAQPSKADPEFSRQPIISVPREADNRSQTIVAPPSVKLKHEVALPNIVAWSDRLSDKTERPRLAIPDAPLTLAAELNRIAPQLENSVVAPPEEVRRSPAAFQASQPSDLVIAPPPSVVASTRPIGELNIGRSAVIAPAPQLAVGEQRTVPGGGMRTLGAISSQVVAPPPSLSAGPSGASLGARGRVIALNLHPAVGASPDPPAGNRRGTFAAGPEGHAGASGSPGSSAGETRAGSDGHANGASKDIPAGLYVGSAGAKSSTVAGDPAGKAAATNAVNPNLTASVRPSRVTSAPARAVQPDSSAKLSEVEREVFGNRRFYSLTLNMPNLNSAGGSWVVRFAELKHESNNRDGSDHNSVADDLSSPAATRKVDPAYPLQLMRENVAGTVILYAVIQADGTVGNVRVLRGVDNRLDQFASEAVAQWKFQPATRNGTPVDVEATFQIPFRPARVGTNF